jgi:tripartite-type tricarboxylate transporter receptor subunit TctC
MAMPWRKISAAIATVALIAILAAGSDRRAAQAQGQPWPQRPVHLIAPYAAGGNSDGIARLIAQRLGDAFGQTFVVENRLGANGAIATEAVARSPADGYTLLWAATPPLTINPALTKVNYDPVKDFAPISAVATNAFVLVVNKDFPPKSVAEFIAYVRAQPTKLAYAEGSAGSLTHLAMALFLKRAGLQMTNVSYRGNAPALTDVVAGHLPTMFSNVSDAIRRLPPARSGFLPCQAKRARRNCPTFRPSPNRVFPISTCSPGMG